MEGKLSTHSLTTKRSEPREKKNKKNKTYILLIAQYGQLNMKTSHFEISSILAPRRLRTHATIQLFNAAPVES